MKEQVFCVYGVDFLKIQLPSLKVIVFLYICLILKIDNSLFFILKTYH